MLTLKTNHAYNYSSCLLSHKRMIMFNSNQSMAYPTDDFQHRRQITTLHLKYKLFHMLFVL